MSRCRQKKIAIINDLSGYGRCSLTVALPVLSVMGIQCCPVPTSILSNHTGFPVWFFDDYTDKMGAYIEKWKELNLDFDGILTGFLGSAEQIRIVEDMIRYFKKEDTTVIVDPIMGDHGKRYSTYTPELCREMERLVRLADVITPNVTESCMLTGRPYREEGFGQRELEEMAGELQRMGPSFVVITGAESPESFTNTVLKKGNPVSFTQNQRTGKGRPGTGDLFSAVLSGALVRGLEFYDGVTLASDFVAECIRKSEELEIPTENGVCFEELLPKLISLYLQYEKSR